MTNRMLLMAILPLALLLFSCGKSGFDSDTKTMSYAMGYEEGKAFVQQQIDLDTEAYALGFTEYLLGKKQSFSDKEMNEAFRQFAEMRRGNSVEYDRGLYSYGVGFRTAKALKAQDVPYDSKVFFLGVKDGFLGAESKISEEEKTKILKKYSEIKKLKDRMKAIENKKKGDRYLAENKKKPGVVVTKSGLQYKVIKRGRGPSPKATDTVKVHYWGKLLDGTEFDSSYKRNEPAEFAVNRVIPGWTEALQLMRVGDIYELTIPGKLGYGPQGNGTIPGNAVLIFRVELLSIQR